MILPEKFAFKRDEYINKKRKFDHMIYNTFSYEFSDVNIVFPFVEGWSIEKYVSNQHHIDISVLGDNSKEYFENMNESLCYYEMDFMDFNQPEEYKNFEEMFKFFHGYSGCSCTLPKDVYYHFYMFQTLDEIIEHFNKKKHLIKGNDLIETMNKYKFKS